MQYTFNDKCRSITGRTDSYEADARKMVTAAMLYFDNNPADKFTLEQYNTPVEITMQLPLLFQTIMEAAEYTPAPETLAHVLGHVKFAVQHGWDAYIQNMMAFGKSDYTI